LVESGALRLVKVESWPEPAYLAVGARVPRRISAAALLSPFDPLVWFRPRTSRLFGFDYRLEIYTPETKRKWGYYVLPFLLGDKLVARVDLKADRSLGVLQSRAAYLEPGEDPGAVATALASELRAVAEWLGLTGIRVTRRGNLSRDLASALKS
jgi:uncharacterized protein YcaQ